MQSLVGYLFRDGKFKAIEEYCSDTQYISKTSHVTSFYVWRTGKIYLFRRKDFSREASSSSKQQYHIAEGGESSKAKNEKASLGKEAIHVVASSVSSISKNYENERCKAQQVRRKDFSWEASSSSQQLIQHTQRERIIRDQASNKTDDLLNLSILISRGNERNIDYLSIGERRGNSTNLKSLELRFQRIVVQEKLLLNDWRLD